MKGVTTSSLYTGQPAGKPKRNTVKEDKKRDSVERGQKVAPYAEVISDLIQKDIEEICNIKSLIVDGKTEDELRIELAVKKRQVAYLTSLENRLTNLVRAKES